MKIDAKKITQKGGGEEAEEITQYITCLPFKILSRNGKIHIKTSENPDGYQRNLRQSRISGEGGKSIPGYILKQLGVFPTSFLVNIRKSEAPLEFETEKELWPDIEPDIEIGKLKIPDNVTWYIIDGQHRWSGLKSAINKSDNEDIKEYYRNYPIIMTITNEDKLYEMLIFYIVNNRIKSVPTDLSYHLMRRQFYEEFPQWVRNMMSEADKRKAIASKIVMILNERSWSPFKEKIKEYGEVKEDFLAKDGQLTKYISYIVKERIFYGMRDEDLAQLIANYWKALKNIYQECFDDPEKYAMFGTIGLSSLNRLFPTIYGYCTIDNDTSQKNMESYLRYLLKETKSRKSDPESRKLDPSFEYPINENWWHKEESNAKEVIGGTGEGHYKYVKEQLARKIAVAISREEEQKSKVGDD